MTSVSKMSDGSPPDNALPVEVFEIQIGNKFGCFRAVFPHFVQKKQSRLGRWLMPWSRTLLFALTIVAAICNAASARNTGVIAADDPNRAWFARPKVHACCDYSDGRFVPFRVNDAGKYEIQIDGKWWLVPDAAVRSLDGEKNPYLEALAWYGTRWSYEDEDETQVQVNTPDIRCFIPGAGT